MIIWLASYPRSGNTFLRISLHRLYGIPTYSVYDDDDPVAQRVGTSLVGYRPKPATREELAASGELFFVKTHKRRKTDGWPAIYLVRDGRDAVVSQARLKASSPDSGTTEFETLLREEILRPFIEGQPSSGSWGANVLSWIGESTENVSVLRYEELIADPRASLERSMSRLAPEARRADGAAVPEFEELHAIDPGFFRRGVVGSHQDEMSDELHELFWSRTENAEAMRLLGYEM